MADSFVSKEYLQKQFQNYSTVVKDNFEKKGAVTAETLKYTNVNKPIVDTVKNALDLLFKEGGGGGDSSVTLTQEEYEALTEEQKLNGLYYIYDTKRIYKNGVQYGASEPIPLTMAEYETLKEAGAIDEQQEYLIEADDKGILISAEDIGYNNAKSGIQATTVQDAIDKIAENSGSGEKNVQSDWNETDDTADGFIKNKPTIPDITGLATETYVDNKVADYTKTADLADVATSGSYNDLADKPTIPDVYDDTALSNRVKTIEDDYAKSSDIPSLSGYATETWVNEQGFLTQHQDISNLVEKEDGKTLISTEDISQIAQNKIDIETLNGTGEGSVEKKIADKLSEQTYLTKEIATTNEVAAYIADPTTAKFNVIYLVKDESATGADKYFEYQRIGNEESSSFQMTGDTSTNLSDYAKTADIPTSLPANGGNADTVNNHTVESDVPENAVFTDTIYNDTEVKGSIDELSSNLDTLEFGEVAGGKNLFNKETAHIGKVILFSSGEMITNADYFCTDYIPVIPNTTYVRSAFTTLGENWYYDIDKNPLNSIQENENIFTTPENAYYVRLSGGVPNVDIAQLEEGSVATEYEPYIPSVKMIAEEVNQQNESLLVIGKCKNLFKPTLQTTTLNGVTCTANGDGTYTLKGKSTSSSNTNFVMPFSSPFKGKCKLIGCPSDIDSIAELQCNYNGVWDSKNTDNGKGSILDSTNLLTDIAIVIFPNVSVNNLVFKPMITTNLNATYDDFVPYTGDGDTLTHDVAEIKNDLSASNAGAHNSVYRGKYLGNVLTTEQKAQISAGTFNDLYIGDYWTIGGVNYRIAGFDYWLNSGDTNCTTHHVVIVPDTCLYSAQMNTSIITTGAYVGSAMYTSNLEQAKTIINNAFGSANILFHREYLANATKSTTDPTYERASSWYDSTVELMNERMVYGADVFHNIEVNGAIPKNYTIDKSQLPLFVLEPSRICNRADWWLRDVVSAASFATVGANGLAGSYYASYSSGVRPAFAIKG